MAVYTLAEAARRERNPLRRGVIRAYGEASPILDFVPLQTISGNSYSYTTRTKLPGVAFRGINESFTPSKGAVNPQTESLKIAGGVIDVDTFHVDTQADRTVGDLMSVETQAQGEAMGKYLTKIFFKGDSNTDPRQFDGLQRRLIGNQLIAMGSTDGGDALTLDALDELIDSVIGSDSQKVLFLNRVLIRKVNKLMRGSAQATEPVGGSFGRKYQTYRDVPLVAVEEDETDTDILGFTEVGPGGSTATCSSVYCVRFGADQYTAFLQGRGGMKVNYMGELQEKEAYRTRVQWYLTLAVFHGRAAGRLWGVKNG